MNLRLRGLVRTIMCCHMGSMRVIPLMEDNTSFRESTLDITLLSEDVICRGGARSDSLSSESFENPLNIDNTTTIAIVATATPDTDMSDIMFTAWCCL